MNSRSLALAEIGVWFLISWLTMLLLPYVTQGAFTPGYWQVFWGLYVLAIVGAFVKGWLRFSPS